MDNYERLIEIDRASVNKEEGTFNSTLATNGEASDGHIISIKGLRMPAKMPLLFGHRSEAMVPVLGSVVKPVKSTEGGLERVRVEGRFNLNGEGQLSDIRRGMFQLVADGDISAMSLRWSGEKVVRRTELPVDHPFHVDQAKTSFQEAKRWGLYFEKSLGLEGSIVALGADPKALIGRSESASSPHERIFFRELARSAENSEDSTGSIAQAMAAVEEAITGIRAAGCDDADIVNLLGGTLDTKRMYAYRYKDGHEERVLHLPYPVYEQLLGESQEVLRAAMALSAGTLAEDDEERELDIDEVEPPKRKLEERLVAAPGTIGAMNERQLADAVGTAVGTAMDAVAYRLFGKVK